MKIVDRKTFLQMPINTLFSTYIPCLFGDLSIKGRKVGDNDYYYQQISDAIRCGGSGEFADILFKAQETGDSIKLDFYCEGRDGSFEDGLFAVWEKEDVAQLIERLQLCLLRCE